MATTMKTPGVYIKELDAFGNSVVAVPTAVPAFIGYTQSASFNGKSLTNVPTKITSLADYQQYFGGAPTPTFALSDNDPESGESAPAGGLSADGGLGFNSGSQAFDLSIADGKWYLYWSLVWFYNNGGGDAFIVSIGDYDTSYDITDLQNAIPLLEKEQEPTMVVIPDAMVSDSGSDILSLQEQMITHCASVMKSRFAILDVFQGWMPQTPALDPIANFRDISMPDPNALQWCASYYPWLYSTVVPSSTIDYTLLNAASKTVLKNAIDAEIEANDNLSDTQKNDYQDVTTQIDGGTPESGSSVGVMDESTLAQTLSTISTTYNDVINAMHKLANLLPPSAAMAGVYTATDNAIGVWKAPANAGVASAESLTVDITNAEQEDLNVPLTGKAVNAIRSFVGEGIKVWGARTMLGNSNDWRYINVRRTLIFLEQSIKAAARAYVFAPNDANTWSTMKSMIENFLNNQWKAGAIVGTTAPDAYVVSVGLGSTMTNDDILNGIMKITVLVAPSRPAEFIEITFQQKQQA